ncbi:MAG: type I-B CRISPR-associated protein Cas7/Cst2/DevR [Spirochaetota bacterium]|nr:type I-B CRISPR-associated protein Cas7/Cst2/DevR [Spirochaetota bacterium]
MSITIQSLFLVDTHVSILNNLGQDETTFHENSVAVKKIKKEGKFYTYASGQAFRNWLRTTLGKDLGWKLSPIIREKKIAFTEAKPVEYPDDDLFGYMRASKEITLTRVSPFKNSALISVTPVKVMDDFKVMARHEGDPVPYGNQPYSAILKGIFSIDLNNVGTFYTVNKTGYLNCTEEYIKEHKTNLEEENDPFFYKDANTPHKRYRLAQSERMKRVSDSLTALHKLSGGASQTAHLTDITPKFMILCAIEGGNHIFSHVVFEKENRTFFSREALEEVLNDYKNELKSPVYIGRRKGFMEEWDKELSELSTNRKNIIYHSPVEITKQFIENKEFKGFF